MSAISTYPGVRYLVPLKEGGSLPAIVDTDGGGLFVVKFRGAGQGAKTLVAEIVVGQLARELGLPAPEIAIVTLHEGFGRTEKDPEIQDILKASVGENVGLRYLEEAYTFDPLAVPDLDPDLAARIVWLDAFVSNVDRTPRNPNLLYRPDGLWLIDHGAALYFHHSWSTVDEERMRAPFVMIRDHVLLRYVDEERLRKADEEMAGAITDGMLASVLGAVPDTLFMSAPAGTAPPFESPEENRKAYCAYFRTRLESGREFLEEAVRAARGAKEIAPEKQGYRR